MRPQSSPTGPSSVCRGVRPRNSEPGGQASYRSTLHLSALKYFLLGPRGVITGLATLHPQLPAPLRLEHPHSGDSEVTCGCLLPSGSMDLSGPFLSSVTRFHSLQPLWFILHPQFPPSPRTASSSSKALTPFLSSNPPVPKPCLAPRAQMSLSLLIDESLSPPQILQVISDCPHPGWDVPRSLLHSCQMWPPSLSSAKHLWWWEPLRGVQARLGASSGSLCPRMEGKGPEGRTGPPTGGLGLKQGVRGLGKPRWWKQGDGCKERRAWSVHWLGDSGGKR